ncbi:MAG: PorT family protein [Flavobacteriaceae bacterium]|nr:PorT family protein [Flavobacteriaceae bacterium]
MKKILLIIAVFSFGVVTSQNDKFFDFGAVFGFNYGSNGDLSQDFTASNLSSDKKSGFHAGVYLNFNLGKTYLRPEILYTKTKSAYESNDFDVTKIDLPIMYGIKLLKPLSIFFGPSLQYTLNTKLENVDANQIEIENDLAVNAQFGAALQLGKQIRLDARYEIGISNNISSIENSSTISNAIIDNKPNQLILSVSLQL